MGIEAIQTTVVPAQQVQRVEPITTDGSYSSGSITVTPAETAPVQARQDNYDSDSQQGQTYQQGKKDEGKNLQDVNPEKVKSAIADINKKIAPTRTRCEFKYHEATNRISITVRDKDTDKIIKEIPPEKTLDMIARNLELEGILVDEKR